MHFYQIPRFELSTLYRFFLFFSGKQGMGSSKVAIGKAFEITFVPEDRVPLFTDLVRNI